MPDKTISDIRSICQKHTILALNKWDKEKDEKYDTIKNWLNILSKLNSNASGSEHDIIPRVLKYIALYEERADNSIINLRDCYLALSDLSKGVGTKYLDENSNYFLFQCLTKLAEALRTGDTKRYKEYLASLKVFDKLGKGNDYPGESNFVLNPLHIPTELLKKTDTEINIDVFEDASSKIKSDVREGFLNRYDQ